MTMLTVDEGTRVALVDGKMVALSRKEFDLLVALAQEPTHVVTKAELQRDVWGYPEDCVTRTIDAHACRLRSKLPAGLVVNSPRVGYRLCDPGSDVRVELTSGGSTAALRDAERSLRTAIQDGVRVLRAMREEAAEAHENGGAPDPEEIAF